MFLGEPSISRYKRRVQIPVWLTLLVAITVIIFGVYRLWVALKPSDETEGSRWDQKSLFGRTKRANLLYGIAYLVLGIMLVLASAGVKLPFMSG